MINTAGWVTLGKGWVDKSGGRRTDLQRAADFLRIAECFSDGRSGLIGRRDKLPTFLSIHIERAYKTPVKTLRLNSTGRILHCAGQSSGIILPSR